MASPAQIEANRANARKSTGPKTVEGKDASRRNALKHGLAAETLALTSVEAEAVAARIEAWTPCLRPRDEHDAWLVEQVVVGSFRVERCQRHEAALRARQESRAAHCWDEDRDEAAEQLGGTLARAKSPALVVLRLRRTKQGCAWLIRRWEALGRVLEAKADWDAAQERLAFDLLGTPREFRDGPTPLDGDRPALVADQVALLESLKAGPLDELDAHERAAAEAGLGSDLDRGITLARRYEAACARRMEWARKQIGKGVPAGQQVPREPQATDRIEPETADGLGEWGERLRREAASAPPPLPIAPGMIPSRVDILKAVASRTVPAGANRRERRAVKARNRRA